MYGKYFVGHARSLPTLHTGHRMNMRVDRQKIKKAVAHSTPKL